MAEKSVEVIIPVRNMAGHLPKVLPPLLAQRAHADVVTVVNDASTDDTEAVPRSLAANVVALTKSPGPFYARQVAAHRSAADILLFVDARCRPLPGLLDAHRQLHGQPGVALSCTDVRTLSGPSLAARVAALQQPFSLRKVARQVGPRFIQRPILVSTGPLSRRWADSGRCATLTMPTSVGAYRNSHSARWRSILGS